MWAKSEIRESGGKGFGLYLQQDIKVGQEKSLEKDRRFTRLLKG